MALRALFPLRLFRSWLSDLSAEASIAASLTHFSGIFSFYTLSILPVLIDDFLFLLGFRVLLISGMSLNGILSAFRTSPRKFSDILERRLRFLFRSPFFISCCLTINLVWIDFSLPLPRRSQIDVGKKQMKKSGRKRGISMTFMEYEKNIQPFIITVNMDWQGQKLSELLMQVMLVAFSLVAFVVGYTIGSFQMMLLIYAGGVTLTTLVTVPNWPFFNHHPLNWLDPAEAEKHPKPQPLASKKPSSKQHQK
ncbi:hypothetical protein ACLOJK_025445 [Asimina triloba]